MPASAQFRRNAQRDDRRRRLMTDEALGDVPVVSLQAARLYQPTARKSEHYGDAEFLTDQPQLTDLIAQRPLTLGLGFGAGIVIIAALEAACSYVPQGNATANGFSAVFDLSQRNCLAAWFMQLSLLATSLMAIVVYSVRRHRNDDYQGRYRIWLWGAAAWFLVASDKASGLHEGLQQTMIGLSGTQLWGDGALWWIIPYLIITAAIATRLFWDISVCWPALTALATATACYGAALIVRLTAVHDESVLQRAMLQQGAEMAGHWLGLLAVCLFARHVLRDAEGRLPRREAKAKATAVDKPAEVGQNATQEDSVPVSTATNNGTWKAIDAAHPTPSAPLQSRVLASHAVTPVPKPAPVAAPTAPASPLESPANHKLSKAEKKALKERLMRERLSRQQKW